MHNVNTGGMCMINRFTHAIEIGDEIAFALILNHHPDLVNQENENGLTPLSLAAHFGRVDMVVKLLENGADANAISHSQIPYIPSNTALHAAIAGKKNPEIIRILIDAMDTVDVADSNGYTPLHIAAFDDSSSIAQMLLDACADVYALSFKDESVMDIALKRNSQKIIKLLKDR
jgi:ankyrin repeat protein